MPQSTLPAPAGSFPPESHQAFRPHERDRRTFGAMQTRLVDDLNRPDLVDIVIDYLLDAIRFWARKPFFFTEVDNTDVLGWRPNTIYPLGSTIRARARGREWAFVAMQVGLPESGSRRPHFTDLQWLQWPGSWYYTPPPLDAEGVVRDGEVIWVNIGPFQPGYYTSLTTVPNQNQYIPPIDYVAPYQVQLTTANLRLLLVWLPFIELSSYDVIRPAPIAAYPRWWSFFRQRLYFWVYPNGFFPITLNYTAAPALPVDAGDSNYWTTTAERLIRKSAQAAISREVLYDTAATQLASMAAMEELSHLKAQAVAQQGYSIPAEWGWE